MAALDKYLLCERLKELGWREASEDELEPPDVRNRLVPPDSLWANKQQTFHVYQARDIQELLGVAVDEDDDDASSDSETSREPYKAH
jgi:hypothetical protein